MSDFGTAYGGRAGQELQVGVNRRIADHADDELLAPLRGRDLVPDDMVAVCVVGSAARGWENSRSDVDVYIVTRREWSSESSDDIAMPLNPPRVQTESFYASGRRWEITYWTQGQVDQLLNRVSWEAFDQGVAAREALALREEHFLARLAVCRPIHGVDWVASTRGKLGDSAFRAFQLSRSLSHVDEAVEDALGQLEAGDLPSATLSARSALGYAIDALLESYGEYGSNIPKWRARRFAAVAPAEMTFEQYWELETMATYDPADPRPWVRQILNLCQDFSMKIEIA